MADDPINELVNVVDLFGTAPNYWKLRDEAMAGDGLPRLPEGSPAYEYTGGTVVYGEAEVRQAQREAYEAGRISRDAEVAGLHAAYDAATFLAGETIDARNIEIAELRAQITAAPQPPKEKS